MSSSPLISVVIPTYNRAQKTIAAIESVLAQTYPHLEIVVADDGSTDGSGAAIQRFIEQKSIGLKNGRQISYFSQANCGPSTARNLGIKHAQGEYIAFLDSDDAWVPEKLEWQMRAIEHSGNRCGACFTDARLVGNSEAEKTTFKFLGKHYDSVMGIEPEPLVSIAKAFGGYWISTLLARTDLVRQIGCFDPTIWFCEDRDLYFRLCQVTSLAYVDKPLMIADKSRMEDGSDGRVWENLEIRLRNHQKMMEKWLIGGTTLPEHVRKEVQSSLRVTHSQWANWHLENERYEEALESVSDAIKYELTPGLALKWLLTWMVPAFARKVAPKAKPYLA
jgi:glycosyltransferase involved in cell wall biosynthesis